MSPRLLAAGYLNVDVTAIVARVPSFGERVTALSLYRRFGGMTANAACTAARLGLRTEFFGRVGGDLEGDAALAELERFGVGTRWVTRTRAPTSTALVMLGLEGERAIISEPMTFDYAPLQEAVERFATEGEACLHLDGYRLPEALSLVRRARGLGLHTSADLDGIESKTLRKYVREIAASLDVVVLNQRLADALEASPQSVAERLSDLGAGIAAVTLGARGAVVAHRNRVFMAHAPSVEVRDTTGAGDAFTGGFLAGWFGGRSAEGAARLAVATGAISVGGSGARGHLPDKEEAERLARSVVTETEERSRTR